MTQNTTHQKLMLHLMWMDICWTKNSFFFLITYYIYFWLCWVFVAAHGLSLVVLSGGRCWLQCTGFSLQWLLLLWSTGYRYMGFSGCNAQVQYLWHMDLIAPWYVASSWTRDHICVPCTGRQILTHCITGEVQIC